jgi:predicted metal-binding protein
MANQELLQKVFNRMGLKEFRWIDPKEIAVAQWVRMKCMFGCDSYGKNASCPPNTPSIPECRAIFDSYKLGTIFRFSKRLDDPEERHEWTKGVNKGLHELEKQVFNAGHYKAFMLFVDNCRLCRDCTSSRASCRNKKMSRPSPEAMGVDVFETATKFGLSINVLPDENQEMNMYAILLIE